MQIITPLTDQAYYETNQNLLLKNLSLNDLLLANFQNDL
jgi:hypothetical protein